MRSASVHRPSACRPECTTRSCHLKQLPQAVERMRMSVQLRRLAAATSASPRTGSPAGGGSAASGDCASAAEEAAEGGATRVCRHLHR